MELDELFGARALNTDTPELYTHWAEQQLIDGNPSESILILASLGLDKQIERSEVTFYFTRYLQESGIEWPSQRDSLRHYANLLCRKIISAEITPEQGAAKLADIHVTNYQRYDYDTYAIWGDIDEALYMLYMPDGGYYYLPDMTMENKDQYIIDAAKDFLRESMKRTDDQNLD